MGAFGGATPPTVSRGAPSTPGRFPSVQQDYTALSGAVVVPPGALDSWWRFSRGRSAQVRGEVIIYGDSTTFGSGPTPSYSWVQRLRDRSVAAGYTDGGKGYVGTLGEGGVGYDSPEVNAQASYTFTGNPDFGGTIPIGGAGMWYDDGSGANHTLNLQFRGTSARLWYTKRSSNGSLTYSLDGAAPVVLDGSIAGGAGNPFVYLSGLNPSTVHTLQIVNTELGKSVHVGLAPMNDAGVVWNKYAVSGQTFQNVFYGGLGYVTTAQNGGFYQTPLGLTGTSVGPPLWGGASIDPTYSDAARVKPVLAISELGFNDLSSYTAFGLSYWTDYVRKFAGVCRDAGVGGLVLAGQLPYNSEWAASGPARFNVLKNEAYAQGLAFADLFYPIGGPSLSYAGGTTNPHLTKPQYVAQADWLWDNLLGLGI